MTHAPGNRTAKQPKWVHGECGRLTLREAAAILNGLPALVLLPPAVDGRVRDLSIVLEAEADRAE